MRLNFLITWLSVFSRIFIVSLLAYESVQASWCSVAISKVASILELGPKIDGIDRAHFSEFDDLIRANRVLQLDIPNFGWDRPYKYIFPKIFSREFYVYRSKGKIVGAMSFIDYSSDTLMIATLAVIPEFQRRGIGKEFVRYSIQNARESRRSKIIARSYLEYEAEGFYLNLGFHQSPTTETYNGHPYYTYTFEMNPKKAN